MSTKYNPKPVLVLFVHHGHQWIRGSERVLIDHLNYLDRNKYNPVLWTNCGPLAKMTREQGIQVVEDRFSYLLDYGSPKFDVANYLKLLRRGVDLIRRNNVSIVHCNASEPCQWMVPAARWENVPLVVQLHLDSALRSRCIQLAHQASVVVGVCDALIAPFREDGVPEDLLRVIRNNVDSRHLISQPKVTRTSLKIDKDEFVFAAVGSLVSHKGFDFLVRALEDFKSPVGTPLLLIIGSGPERKKLEMLVHDLKLVERVWFLGDCPHAPALMRDVANAVVLPSLREAVPIVLLEAGFYGRPCVATDVGGVGEIIRHEETGLLVLPGDVKGLRSAMQRLVENREYGRYLGTQLNMKIKKEMLTPTATRQLETLYEEQLNKRQGRRGQKAAWHWYPGYSRLIRRAGSRLGQILVARDHMSR